MSRCKKCNTIWPEDEWGLEDLADCPACYRQNKTENGVAYTNVLGLPEPMVKALSSDHHQQPYRIGVTSLIGPPIVRQLRFKHSHEIEKDVSDNVWMFFGSMVHEVLERADGCNVLSEEKLTVKVMPRQADRYSPREATRRLLGSEPWTIVGKSDVLDADGILWDYKVTSLFAFLLADGGVKQEWIAQLNCYAWLWRREGFEINGLKILAILRDWSSGKAKSGGNYPQKSIVKMDVPMWSAEEAEAYILDRITYHNDWEGKPIEDIPICTPAERWKKETTYAVMKNENKRACKNGVHTDRAKADERLSELEEAGKPSDTFRIEERPGEETKCARFCDVAEFCPYGRGVLAQIDATPVDLTRPEDRR